MIELGALTWPEVSKRAPLTLVIPLGSTEQHGPHLPLDTDTRIAEAVASRVVDAIESAALGPTIAIGASGEHAGFAGTLSIGTTALTSVLVEIVRTIGPEFGRVAIINAHGGNAEAVGAAVALCEREGRRLTAWSIRLSGADAHAGHTETSIMLVLAPHLVRLDLTESGNTESVADLLPRLQEGGLRQVTPNGVLGDPAGATAAEGRRLLDRLVADAVAVVDPSAAVTDSGA